jgi:hypothetical protein
MEFLKYKKKSFLMTLFSILMILYGINTKYFDLDKVDYLYGSSKYLPFIGIPKNYLIVKFFGINFSYLNFQLFFIIVLVIGIYLLIYKNDQSFKNLIKKSKLYIKKKKRRL